MTKYGLRARVITLTLAPTLIIGLLLSAFFSISRFHDLETQAINAGINIIEPLSIAVEQGLTTQNRESVRRLISYAHRKNSQLIRSIAVFDINHELFVTSNFHPNFEVLTFPRNQKIPLLSIPDFSNNSVILRTPIITENQLISKQGEIETQALGYIAIELDLTALRLQQYQEIAIAFVVLIIGLGLASLFAYRLMHDVTRPITHMKEMVDNIRRGHLGVRIEGDMHGELDNLKNGINAMAISLSEYHVEMQHSIDQATSDLRETLEQLEIQNIELDLAKKKAQEAARVKSEFLANMSHELRTPLNGVIGFTRQMLKTQLTVSQTDYLQTIERSAKNLLRIINDILDFSKLEAGKLALENIPFELQDVLDEVVSLQATTAHEKGLEITLSIDPKIPEGIIGDPMRIQQVLTNLIGNSIKFTERGNIDIRVELRSHKENTVELQFVVKDTGIGISERQQAQLFQAFSQADASISRRYGGTGLGLVITQKLVGQMGGSISLTSRLHQGSSFWFTLHLNTTEIPLSNFLDSQSLQHKSLLLIEPNQQTATIIKRQLTDIGMLITHILPVQQPLTPNIIQQGYDEVVHYDFIMLNFSPNQACLLEQVEMTMELAQHYSAQLIVTVPSTELAFAEQLSKQYNILCLAKPLARKKLLQHLLLLQTPSLKQLKPTIIGSIQPPPQLELAKQPLSVMAVDDNPANLKLITALLQERVMKVTACSDGKTAVAAAKLHKFDIVFMDIQMPQMDGVTACQKIKQTPLNANTPVIAVTAHAMVGERERLLAAGMDDYLTKPIEEATLLQQLSDWKPSLNTTPQPTVTPLHPDVIAATAHQQSIDWNLALKQTANKEDLAKEMLTMLIAYFIEIEQLTTELIEILHNNGAIDDEQQQTFLHHIHKLNGSSAYCGVPQLKILCNTIEKALRSGTKLQELEPELLELQDEMDKIKSAAKDYL